MKKFKVKIIEELSRDIVIEAESIEEAREKAEDAYRDGEIVLDYDDYFQMEIFVEKIEEKK